MTRHPPPARGVYTLTFTDAIGNRLAAAITHAGRCLVLRPYQAGEGPAVENELQRMLDAADPLPVLKLV
jgi:hypothetical protein